MLNSNKYLVRRKVFSVLGAVFEVYDGEGNLILYAKQKAFRLREELRFYANKEMKEEVFSIKARNIIDFSATYDVKDSKSGSLLGSLRRKGIKSIIRDEWIVLDGEEKEHGRIMEDSMSLAMIRRFLLNIIPQNYDYIFEGKKVADFRQRFNPFVYKLDVDILSEEVDKRVVLASAVILSLIEGRQE